MIPRAQESRIEAAAARKKAVIIMGPRQVGKSTLLHQMLGNRDDVLWLNGDNADTRRLFEDFSTTKMRLILNGAKTLVVDEAQRIPDIGLSLKIVIDQMPGIDVYATGSSSFDLSASVNESLAGRKREFNLMPLSFGEMAAYHGIMEEKRMLSHRMCYGYYPEVVTGEGEEKLILKELTDSYLYKDILALGAVQKPDRLVKLVQALAFKIGSQISLNELSRMVGLDVKTVGRYIDVLAKCFIIFPLGSFSRNLRNELKSSRKVYFHDLGIRNAVIGNFAPIEHRSPEEAGALWKNFVIAERLKYNNIHDFMGRYWFWRTTAQKEVDYLEEADGIMQAYEIKYNPKAKAVIPPNFKEAYPDTTFTVVTPDNIEGFLTGGISENVSNDLNAK